MVTLRQMTIISQPPGGVDILLSRVRTRPHQQTSFILGRSGRSIPGCAILHRQGLAVRSNLQSVKSDGDRK